MEGERQFRPGAKLQGSGELEGEIKNFENNRLRKSNTARYAPPIQSESRILMLSRASKPSSKSRKTSMCPIPVSASKTVKLMVEIRIIVEAPGEELAQLYPQRWKAEVALDEFKTHLWGGRVVLQIQTPECGEQEVYGMLLAQSGDSLTDERGSVAKTSQSVPVIACSFHSNRPTQTDRTASPFPRG